MAASPNYFSTPVTLSCALSNASPTRLHGDANQVLFYSGNAKALRVDDIRIQALGATTAGMIRFFLSVDSGAYRNLIHEVPVQAVTPSATVQAWSANLSNLAWVLQGVVTRLYVSTHNAESFVVFSTRAGLE